jgi:hypothetical protein
MTRTLAFSESAKRPRRERKYLVDGEQLAAFHARTSALLQADQHGQGRNGYFNHSIYFDSPEYGHYADKREGISQRSKPRLRSYRNTIDGPPTVYFLEFKNRLDQIVWKDRLRLTNLEAEKILHGGFCHEMAADLEPDLLARFLFQQRLDNLTPAVTVFYHRRAFFTPLEPSLRITYDSRIMGALAARSSGGPDGYRYVLPPHRTVLEVKYDFGYPQWLRCIITDLELPLISLSKYGLTLEALLDRSTTLAI